MTRKKMNQAFFPVFSGIKPTANMTLPTYLRQLQYLEKVLTQLVEEVNLNFENFDGYLDEQIGEIESASSEIIRSITIETIDTEVALSVGRELTSVLENIANLQTSLASANSTILQNSQGLVQLNTEVDGITTRLNEAFTNISSTLTDANLYTLGKFDESKTYTDTKTGELITRINDLDTGAANVNSLVDGKLAPIAIKVNKNEADLVSANNRMNIIDEKIDRSSTTILNQRISEVDTKVSVINTKIDTMQIPDLTAITTKVSSLETTSMDNSSSIASTLTKINAIEVNAQSLSSDLTLVKGRVTDLENGPTSSLGSKVDILESDISNADGRISTLETFRSNYNNVDKVVERLDSAESRLDAVDRKENVLSSYPEYLKFPDGQKTVNNNITLNSIPLGDKINYKGVMMYDFITLVDFDKYKSTTATGKPLNIPSAVSLRSDYIQNPIVNYDIKYKNTALEIIEVNGVDLRATYKFEPILDSIDGYISIESDKLSKLKVKMTSDGATDIDIKVSIQCDLMFQKRSD